MNTYEHTQPGTFFRILFGLLIVTKLTIFTVMMFNGHDWQDWKGLLFGPGVMLVILALFHSMTIRVSHFDVSFSLGIGLIRRSIPLEQIESCETVRNAWWHGLGIKKISRGWLYCVSGLDAVEIKLQSGKVCRLGTDEPAALEEAISTAISATKPESQPKK